MKRVLTILLIVLFVAVYSSVMAAPGGGGPAQVTVVNTADKPVPVNVQNQPTVNINGTPNVNIVNTKKPFGGVVRVFIAADSVGETCADFFPPEDFPYGNPYVITHISYAGVGKVGEVFLAKIVTSWGSWGSVNFLQIIPSPIPNLPANAYGIVGGGQHVELYSDYPPSAICAERLGGTGSATIDFSFAGYAVE